MMNKLEKAFCKGFALGAITCFLIQIGIDILYMLADKMGWMG